MYKRDRHLLCLNREQRAPDATCGCPPPPPVTCESNSNWLSGKECLRLQPYSEQAGQGCLKQGARVQIVFYKSPLQGICVYPWPLICCWGSLGKREKREWRGTRGKWGQSMVFVLLLDLQRAELRKGGTIIILCQDKFRIHDCWYNCEIPFFH